MRWDKCYDIAAPSANRIGMRDIFLPLAARLNLSNRRFRTAVAFFFLLSMAKPLFHWGKFSLTPADDFETLNVKVGRRIGLLNDRIQTD
jgi:hypothetical protein